MVGGKGRYLGGAFALCLLIAVVTASSSTGAPTCLRASGLGCGPSPLDFTLNARVSPHALPAGKPAPIGVSISGKVGTADARRQVSALREATLIVDKDVEIDVRGLSICGYRKIASRDSAGARRACRKAIVGSGWASAQLAKPGLPRMSLQSRLVAFNGGLRDGARRLLVHAFAPAPLKRTLIARVDLKRVGPAGGPTGWGAMAKIPRIGDGYGSLTAFRLNLKRFFFHRRERRSFLSARCPDGAFSVSAPKLEFRNEANIPGMARRTVFKGDLTVPCKPKR